MRDSLARLCIAGIVFVFIATGCGPVQSLIGSSEDVPPDTSTTDVAVADTVSTSVTPVEKRVQRLYALESRILAAPDSASVGPMLNQAMSELAALLDADPSVIERDAVRSVYRGLTAEYRRYHGYGDTTDTMDTARGSIFAVRAELFASLEDVDEPLLEDVMPPSEAREIESVIPLTMNRLVQQSIEYLQRNPDKHVLGWLKREQTYAPMIDHILDEEGAPRELRYLAMIESGLNPQARSWAGAVGMWQFMAATGRMYGLGVDGFVDERRDPEKATRAAAQHLNDLYEEFDDWHLAMAAFNCGGGCVRRALRRSGQPNGTFWDVYHYLPRETRGYVPMFIAATRVATDPEAYGIERPEPGPAYAYDYVSVHGSMLSVYEIARMAETDADVIRALNPELRRSTLPPSREKYFLRIPLGSYPTFAWAYADLPDEKKRPATAYRVRSGDTLSEIADRYGTSTSRLRRTNGIRGSMIRVGQTLVVPVRNYGSALDEASPARPMRVQYDAAPPIRPIDPITITDRGLQNVPVQKASGSAATPPVRTASATVEAAPETSRKAADEAPTASDASTDSETTADASRPKAASASSSSARASSRASQSSSSTSSAAQSSSSQPSRSKTVRVRSGDTLSEIAARHGVGVSDLRRWNGLGSSRIVIGQELRLTAPASDADTYRVRRGDTLDEIARRYGVSVSEIKAWNGLASSRIYAGQTLTVKHDGELPLMHVVQRGDTLGTIARSYDTSITTLRRLNDLRGSRIYIGQKLKVRSGS